MRAPVLVVATGGEWELESGELIIGRNSGATIFLEDPLVSRFHARITVDGDGQVVLEDLQSANGIFVNGIKLSRPSTLLGEGDRLLIGTTELSVFALRTSAMVSHGQPVARVALPSVPIKRLVAVTGRSDAVHLVGQFAEQLMGSGHPLEAARVLSEHLQNLLKGASAGLSVPANILEGATHYALRLHGWTQRTLWLEYVFELHLASLQVPSEVTLAALESVVSATPDLDVTLLGYFVKTLERRPDSLTTEESLRLRRIERLEGAQSAAVK